MSREAWSARYRHCLVHPERAVSIPDQFPARFTAPCPQWLPLRTAPQQRLVAVGLVGQAAAALAGARLAGLR